MLDATSKAQIQFGLLTTVVGSGFAYYFNEDTYKVAQCAFKIFDMPETERDCTIYSVWNAYKKVWGASFNIVSCGIAIFGIAIMLQGVRSAIQGPTKDYHDSKKDL